MCRVDVWPAVVTSYMLMARGAVEGKQTDGESKINIPLAVEQNGRFGPPPGLVLVVNGDRPRRE